MSDCAKFPMYANYWRSIKRIKQPTKRDRFFCAMCAYVFDGVEPDFGGDDELEGRWDLIQSSLDASMAAIQSGSKGGSGKAPSRESHKAPSDDSPKAPSEKSPKAPSVEDGKAPSAKKGKQYKQEHKQEQEQEQEQEVRRSGEPDRRAAEVAEVIDYLNAKTGRNFRAVEANARHIRARLNEGYTVEDCKRVVDLKAGEWMDGESSDGRDMGQYLRPETLFGSKFDGYLNSAPTSPVRSGPRVSLVTGEPIGDAPGPVSWGDVL